MAEEPKTIAQLIDELEPPRQPTERLEASTSAPQYAEEGGFRKIFEDGPFGIGIVDRAYRFLSVNKRLCELLGYTEAELIGLAFADVTYPADTEKEDRLMNHLFRGEIPHYTIEKRYLRKNHEPVWARLTALVLRNEEGVPFRGLTLVWDMTQHKRTEEALATIQAELDQRVEERAAELEKSNEALRAEIIERERIEQELEQSREQLRHLAARLQAAREEERTQVARDIHDELGQALTGLRLHIAWLMSRIPETQPALRERAREMAELVETTTHTVHRIASDLRPGVLDEQGLVAALEWQARDFHTRTGIRCRFTPAHADLPIDPECATALFRIFQATLTNVALHSDATAVMARLEEQAGQVILEVRDNGRGITEQERTSSNSLGLLGMRERTELLGGTITFEGRPGQGTAVRVVIPLATPKSEEEKDEQ